jgi:hypothetical protein
MHAQVTAERVDTHSMRAWLEMIALRPARPRGRPIATSERLQAALHLVERALLRPSGGGVRSVPSAGAIFPYEVLIVEKDTSPAGESIHRVDLGRRESVRITVSDDHRPALVGAAGSSTVLQIVVLARPWLSMRKYGPRGYLYTQLDAAHAATSLVGTLRSLGGSGGLRIAVAGDGIVRTIQQRLPYREVHSILDVERLPVPPGPSTWSGLELSPGHAAHESTDELEGYCWSKLESSSLGQGLGPRPLSFSSPLGVAEAFPRDALLPDDAWPRLTQRRRSCRTFSPAAPTGEQVSGALGAIGTPLVTDLPPTEDGGLGVTLVTPSSDLVDACAWLTAQPGFGLRFAPDLLDGELVARACNGQRHLAGARAFLLFHLDRRKLLAVGQAQTLRDALYRTGAAAQLTYLGAARTGLAATGIGGYDAALWQEIAGLGTANELLYLVAMGTDQDGAEKADRLAVAVAHGE